MQFGVAVVEFLRFCALERQLSGHSVQAYAADLRDFRKWLKADVGIGDVSLDLLKAYLEDMVGSRKLAVATVRRRFACLRAFFRRACEKHDCPDPFANWRPLLPRRKRLPRTLSRHEAAFLLSSRHIGIERADDGEHVFRIIVQLMVATGMRVGELCKLKLDDLSPDCSTVRIQGKGARDRVAYVTDPAYGRICTGSLLIAAIRNSARVRCSSIVMARRCGRNPFAPSCGGWRRNQAWLAGSRRTCCDTPRRRF